MVTDHPCRALAECVTRLPKVMQEPLTLAVLASDRPPIESRTISGVRVARLGDGQFDSKEPASVGCRLVRHFIDGQLVALGQHL